MMEKKHFIRLHAGISHERGPERCILHNCHGKQGVQVFLTPTGDAFSLQQGVADAGRKLTVLRNLRGTQLMAGCGKGVALVDVHHLLRCQIVFDIVQKPARVHLHICCTGDDLFCDRPCLFIRNGIHVFENIVKRKLDDLHAIFLPDDLRISDQALHAECRKSSCGQYQCPSFRHGFSHPESLRDLVQIRQVQRHIGFDSDGSAVGGKIDPLISVLQDHHRLSIAFQLGDPPVHAQEKVYLLQVFFDF